MENLNIIHMADEQHVNNDVIEDAREERRPMKSTKFTGYHAFCKSVAVR